MVFSVTEIPSIVLEKEDAGYPGRSEVNVVNIIVYSHDI
jgi:hypothetical protein